MEEHTGGVNNVNLVKDDDDDDGDEEMRMGCTWRQFHGRHFYWIISAPWRFIGARWINTRSCQHPHRTASTHQRWRKWFKSIL